MAEWQYEMQRVSYVTDSQLEHFLHEQGKKGWELVQALPGAESPNGTKYSVIFKREKTLMSVPS